MASSDSPGSNNISETDDYLVVRKPQPLLTVCMDTLDSLPQHDCAALQRQFCKVTMDYLKQDIRDHNGPVVKFDSTISEEYGLLMPFLVALGHRIRLDEQTRESERELVLASEKEKEKEKQEKEKQEKENEHETKTSQGTEEKKEPNPENTRKKDEKEITEAENNKKKETKINFHGKSLKVCQAGDMLTSYGLLYPQLSTRPDTRLYFPLNVNPVPKTKTKTKSKNQSATVTTTKQETDENQVVNADQLADEVMVLFALWDRMANVATKLNIVLNSECDVKALEAALHSLENLPVDSFSLLRELPAPALNTSSDLLVCPHANANCRLFTLCPACFSKWELFSVKKKADLVPTCTVVLRKCQPPMSLVTSKELHLSPHFNPVFLRKFLFENLV